MGVFAGLRIAVLVLEIAPLGRAAGQVAQTGCCGQCLGQVAWRHAPATRHRPIPPQADGNAQQRKQESREKDRDHHAMRQDGVEPRPPGFAQPVCQREDQRKAQRRGERHGKAAALEQACGGAGKGQIVPAFLPDLRQGTRQVQREFMRLGVLAGVIAPSAVVAEVGQLHHIAIAKGALAMQRRKDCAKPLAVAAGIADLGLTPGFIQGINEHAQRPLCLRSGQRPFRLSCRTRPDSPAPGSTRPSSLLRPTGFPSGPWRCCTARSGRRAGPDR